MVVYMIIEASEEPILIKIIIDDPLTEIQIYLIVYNEGSCTRLKSFFAEWELRKEIVSGTVIKIIPITKFTIVKNISSPPFSQPEPLH